MEADKDILKELFFESIEAAFKVLVEDEPNINEGVKAILEALEDEDDELSFALVYVVAYSYFLGVSDERTGNKKRAEKIERKMGNDK